MYILVGRRMKKEKSLKTILTNTWWCVRLVYRSNPILYQVLLVTQLLASVSPFVRNKIFARLVDELVYAGASNVWLKYFGLFIMLLLVTSIFFYLQSQFDRIMDMRLQAFLRKSFTKKVSGLDYQHLEGKDTGNLISRVDEEFGWRTRQTVRDLNSVVANVASLLTVVVILVPRYPLVLLVIFVAQIPNYFIERYWVQKDWEIYEQNSDKNKMIWDLNYQLRTKSYLTELKVNNAVGYLYKKFCAAFDFFSNSRVAIRIKQAPSEFALMFLATGVSVLSLLTLVSDVRSGLISIGLFTFYFQAISQTAEFFRGLVYSSVSITENSYHIGNFRKVMNLVNVVVDGKRKGQARGAPRIEFVGVGFRYPEAKTFVFRNLNLVIEPEEELAIVGANGAGKSTLIKLLCRFYDPSEGKILVDGHDLREYSLTQWYKRLSLLAQEYNVYGNMTLGDNVRIGNPAKNSRERIENALKKSDAYAFVKNYPQGLGTLMSRRYGGEEPSWGQWQKIAIARVFFRDASVMILDEPTASIDAVSEYKIFNNLYKQVTKKTLIIVSHRFSTVRNAKRIIVFAKGRIVEQGDHAHLLVKGGVYAKSFHLQAEGYQ